jgi:MSHA biogenesis protein MshQ
MKCKFVWLIVLTTLLLAGSARAATYNFNGTASVGSCTLAASEYTCGSLPNSTGTDVIIVADGYTVVVTSAIVFSFNQGLQMSGSAKLESKSNLNIADINPANLKITGGKLKAGDTSTFFAGAQAQTFTADIDAGTINIGTGSTTKVTGALTAKNQVTLAANVTITGPVTGPTVLLKAANTSVTGDIKATTSLTIESNNTVNGNISGGALTLDDGGVVVNGSVKMTGNVSIGSSGKINGDLTAYDVTTKSSNAVINGNAAVNSIYIDWNNSVTKTITCVNAAAGAAVCSCVTKADSNYKPTCGAASAGVPHHFQITHSGSALTCQPQTVTLTACANAACTTPHYSGNVTATLSPGNQPATITSGSTNAATVQSGTAGVYALSASSAGVSNATTCINTGATIGGNSCNMEFKTSGLIVTATNHVSMTTANVTVEAKKADASSQSCVPLVASQTVNTSFTCSYTDPVPAKTAKTKVFVGSSGMVCNQDTASLGLNFDASGKATASLSYAEIGLVGLNASIATSGFAASGSGNFYAAPASLKLTATSPLGATAIGPAALASTATQLNTAFAKAGQSINVAVTAYNNNGAQTMNFGQENTPSAVTFALDAVNPDGGGTSGSLTTGTSTSYASGAVNTSLSFSDVGVIRLLIKLAGDYYMSQQLEPTFKPTGLQHIGRIVPDHFDTELVANTVLPYVPANLNTMDCPLPTSSIYPCGGNTSFTHSGQSFFVRVKAYNGAATPTLTANYSGALARVITLQAMTANGGPTPDGNGTIKWSKEPAPSGSPVPARFTFANGTGSLDMSGASGANLPAYVFSAPHTPVTIYLRATDTDQVSSLRAVGTSVEAPLSVVSGRLLVSNGYGSPTAPLKVSVSAQYLMSSGYVFNSLAKASGSGYIKDYITINNCQKALAIGYCPLKVYDENNAVLSIDKGVGAFKLAVPTPIITGIGVADVRLISKDGVELIPYLPSTTGKETFGVYRSGPVIYTREIY